MSPAISAAKRRLLVRMESMLGNECYNANIQNYGPGGIREAAGRSFRYPLTVRNSDGTTFKVRDTSVPPGVPTSILLSGYYAFGANQLDVMASLNRILDHLEEHYGLVIEDAQRKLD
jgi:hypothetical protein